jgi:hypothetical protein
MSTRPAGIPIGNGIGEEVERIEKILSRVLYKEWDFAVGFEGKVIFLQVAFMAPDAVTGGPGMQLGRRWLIEPGLSAGELVRTAFKAILTAEEHEAREQFKYRGRAVLQPHFELRD